MTNLIIGRGNKVTLNDNKLSGDTYSAKEYIKAYLGGCNFDKVAKTWDVDVNKVNDLIAKNAIRVDDSAAVSVVKSSKSDNGWCDKCQSWCYGDCTA